MVIIITRSFRLAECVPSPRNCSTNCVTTIREKKTIFGEFPQFRQFGDIG